MHKTLPYDVDIIRCSSRRTQGSVTDVSTVPFRTSKQQQAAYIELDCVFERISQQPPASRGYIFKHFQRHLIKNKHTESALLLASPSDRMQTAIVLVIDILMVTSNVSSGM
jgi:hypothetical protein